MRSLIAPISLALLVGATAPGCATTSVVDGGLGKIVIYRNGVAYYERRAHTDGGELRLTVPREQVDDFLKSLTVRDARTGKSLPVSFPSQGQSGGALIEMAVRLPPSAPSEVILTYITEAPAWKPSYRISVAGDGEIDLESWAIVDNTSGETWEEVLIGVGSSSALSFRYDLWSIRDVRRQTLSSEESFAVAPPTGSSTYREVTGDKTKVLSELSADEINSAPTPPPAEAAPMGDEEDESVAVTTIDGSLAKPESAPVSGRSYGGAMGRAGGVARGPGVPTKKVEDARARREHEALEARRRYERNERLADQLAQKLKEVKQPVVIEGYARTGEPEPDDRALERANNMRNQLIERGVAPALLEVRGAGAVEGRPPGVRLVAAGAAETGAKNGPPGEQSPVGDSHFQSATPITVPRGTSTMVSIVKERTRGEMVYLYDSESVRGNQRYAFRAVRLDNPTDNTLESGPVTVYGDGRFIGEGLTDPIPPRSTALIPFALDRQVIVERKVDRRDQISGLVKLQRGVLSSEVQHVRDTELKLTNRMSRPVTVYVRHTVGGGWDLLEAPESERIGTARLFAVALEGGETDTLRIREATPMARTLDLHSEESLDLVEAYLTRSSEHAALAEKIKPLLALHRKMADHRAAIATLREQMADYRVRMDELHGQIVTLKAVKAGGELTRHLKAKLHEISERVQKATLAVVSHQQDLMLARVQFQDAIAELTLEPAAKKAKKVAGS